MADQIREPLGVQPQLASRQVRVTSLLIAAGCTAILAAAMYLTPDPRGFGTHEQLGLPPCISTKFLHVPCPVCGMTTTFSLMAHTRPEDAFRTQPAGAIFFVICLMALAGAVSSLILGHVPTSMARIAVSRKTMWAFTALLAAGWLYKVYVFYR